MQRRQKRVEIKGQMQLPFGQGSAKNGKKAVAGKRPVLAEKRAVKDRSYALARQAYAVLSSPKFRGNPHYTAYRREIGQFIGLCKKNKATYLQAQSKIGMIAGLFDRLGIKYKP